MQNTDSNIERIEKDGFSSIHNVCRDCDQDTERLVRLIEMGTDINAKTALGHSPLHLACVNGNFRIAKLLIKEGADVNAKDANGYPVMHYAVEGSNGTIPYLVEAGADLEFVDQDGQTALLYACSIGKVGAIEKLCSLGADANVVSPNGKSAISFALTSVKSAIASNAAKMIRTLAGAGASVGNIESDTKYSEVMHVADLIEMSYRGEKQFFTILNTVLKLGDDPWRRNSDGVCALDIMSDKHLEIALPALKRFVKSRGDCMVKHVFSSRAANHFLRCQNKYGMEDLTVKAPQPSCYFQAE